MVAASAGRDLSVVHVVSTLREAAGGTSRSVVSLCEAMAALGAQVNLVSQHSRAYGTPIKPIDQAVQSTTSILPRGWGHLQFSAAFPGILERAIKQSAGKILQDHGVWLPTNIVAARIANRLGLPLVVSPHGMLEPWALSTHAIKKRLAWLLYQQRILSSAAIIRVTAEQEAESVRALGIRSNLALIPNGIAIPLVLPPRKAAGGQHRRALFLSRIHEKKGVVQLLEVWARIRPRDWMLSIVGPGDARYLRMVKHAITRLNLDNEVTLSGAVSDVEKWLRYRGADLFILPSFSENFGLVIGEALAAGVPVITTTSTPWKELLQHQCGWWVRMDPDLRALSDALAEATSATSEDLEKMGQRGQRLVDTRYRWDSVASTMIAVYQWVLGRGPRPPCILT